MKRRDIRLQDAVQQAPESSIVELDQRSFQSLDALQGSLSDVDVMSLLREEKQAEYRKERRWLTHVDQ